MGMGVRGGQRGVEGVGVCFMGCHCGEFFSTCPTLCCVSENVLDVFWSSAVYIFAFMIKWSLFGN